MSMSSFLMNPVSYGEPKFPPTDDYSQTSYLQSQASDYYRSSFHHLSHNGYHFSPLQYAGAVSDNTNNTNNTSRSSGSTANLDANGNGGKGDAGVSGLPEQTAAVATDNYDRDLTSEENSSKVLSLSENGPDHSSFTPSSGLSSPASLSLLSNSVRTQNGSAPLVNLMASSSGQPLDVSLDCRVSSASSMCLSSYNHHHNHHQSRIENQLQPHPHHHQLQHRHLQLSPSSTPAGMSPPCVGGQSPYKSDNCGALGASPTSCDGDDSNGGIGMGSGPPVIYPWMRKSQAGGLQSFCLFDVCLWLLSYVGRQYG